MLRFFYENDDEGEENYTEADNSDNNNNEYEEHNLVNDALLMDVEREDGSIDAGNKPSRMHKKMGKNAVVSCMIKAIRLLVPSRKKKLTHAKKRKELIIEEKIEFEDKNSYK